MLGRIKVVWKNQRGVTLVELLIALTLLGVILAGIYSFFFFAQAGWDRSSAEARVAQEARLTLMKMKSEIRQARKATGTTDAVEVWQGGVRVGAGQSGTQLDIYTDVVGDVVPELVRYQLGDQVLNQGVVVGRVLKRGVVAGTKNKYPHYTYDEKKLSWETVISLVTNTDPATPDLFQVAALVTPVDPDDHRRRVTIRLVIDDPERPLTTPLEITGLDIATGPGPDHRLCVVSRSREVAPDRP